MTDIHDLDTDEEIREHFRRRCESIAFDVTELILEAERQLAGLRAMYRETKENLALYRRCIQRAADAGRAEEATDFRNSLRKCLDLRKMIRKRVQTLEQVCRDMENVLHEAKLRGSDA